MSVDLKNFVDINIKQHVSTSITGTRETIVLFSTEKLTSDNKTEVIVNSNDFLTKLDSGATNTLRYLNIYFANGGVKACIIHKDNITDIDKNTIASLPDEYIVITCVDTDTKAAGYTQMKKLAKEFNVDSSIYGINEKIFLATTNSTDDTEKIKNFGVKYSNTLGAEMTMAAYLSKVNVYGTDNIFDYMFTIENETDETNNPIFIANIDDDNYQAIITNNMNVDILLAGAIRNCGGNLKDGADLINQYCLIILHQTLTNRLIDLLSTKIKNSSGLSKIYSVCAQELGYYLTSGYLTTDKVWKEPDLTVNYNNETFTIIEKGTALTDGYLIRILPYTSLTDQDISDHKTPPIYIILGSQYGIRKITINGEVI